MCTLKGRPKSVRMPFKEGGFMFIILSAIIGICIIVAIIAAISTVVSASAWVASREEEQD